MNTKKLEEIFSAFSGQKIKVAVAGGDEKVQGSSLTAPEILRALQHFQTLNFERTVRSRYFSVPAAMSEENMKRLNERWLLSRTALITAVNELLSESVPAASVLLSMSHTESIALAVTGARGALQGIGVDLENSNRAVSEGATKKFATPAEIQFGLGSLEVWNIKEACFKANPLNAGTVISHYSIESAAETAAGTIEGVVAVKSAKIKFCLVKSQGPWLIAFAIC